MGKGETVRLSIIIVSYNSRQYLRDCLGSLVKYPPAAEDKYEIIVVDNASSDGSALMVKENYPGVRLIENFQNLGFAAANNIAIRQCDSDYVLLINSDCEVYEKSVESLVLFMDANVNAGIAGPRIINSDGTLQLSCRRFPSFLDAGMHSILSGIAPDNPFSKRYKLADIKRDVPFEVDWVSGSCMIIRRKALDDTGLMDEKYFMYVEDIDLCYRMWKKNWKVFYEPHSGILHHVGKSTKDGRTAADIRMQKSVLYFFWKNYRKTFRIVFLPVIVVVLGVRILLTFIKNLLK